MKVILYILAVIATILLLAETKQAVTYLIYGDNYELVCTGLDVTRDGDQIDRVITNITCQAERK